jgi:hypothetical protein
MPCRREAALLRPAALLGEGLRSLAVGELLHDEYFSFLPMYDSQ